jgi:cation-transporting ATPase 13A1
MAPKQKEWVINAIKSLGYCTLMCGDGTNDVGALKHAHVGVAILSHCPEWVEKRKKLMQDIAEKKKSIIQGQATNGAEPGAPAGPGGRALPAARQGGGPRRPGPGAPGPGRPTGRPESNFEKQLAKMMKELEEEEKGQIVKLGDASIAAPFSSKMSSIECSKRYLILMNILMGLQ